MSTPTPCFTRFSFDVPSKITPLRNLHSLIFGLTLFRLVYRHSFMPFSYTIFHLHLFDLRPVFQNRNSAYNKDMVYSEVNELRLTIRRELNWTGRICSVFPGMPTFLVNYRLHIANIFYCTSSTISRTNPGERSAPSTVGQ